MLTGKQKRFLRARGHGLRPVVIVGKEGVTDAVVSAMEEALEAHELIKVRISKNTEMPARDVAAELAVATTSELAQSIGSILLFYRARSEEPLLQLP